jgi:hypothetical protein
MNELCHGSLLTDWNVSPTRIWNFSVTSMQALHLVLIVSDFLFSFTISLLLTDRFLFLFIELHFIISSIINPSLATVLFSCIIKPVAVQGFLSLGFCNIVYRHLIGILGRGISPLQGLCLHMTTKRHKRTNDLTVWAVEYSRCLRERGCSDRH